MRNAWARYQEAGVRVIGVSSDSASAHRRFAEKHKLPFSLIPDESGAWAQAFGVKSRFGFHSRRSFLLGKDHKIAKVYSDVDPGVHAMVVLKDVKRLFPGQ